MLEFLILHNEIALGVWGVQAAPASLKLKRWIGEGTEVARIRPEEEYEDIATMGGWFQPTNHDLRLSKSGHLHWVEGVRVACDRDDYTRTYTYHSSVTPELVVQVIKYDCYTGDSIFYLLYSDGRLATLDDPLTLTSSPVLSSQPHRYRQLVLQKRYGKTDLLYGLTFEGGLDLLEGDKEPNILLDKPILQAVGVESTRYDTSKPFTVLYIDLSVGIWYDDSYRCLAGPYLGLDSLEVGGADFWLVVYSPEGFPLWLNCDYCDYL